MVGRRQALGPRSVTRNSRPGVYVLDVESAITLFIARTTGWFRGASLGSKVVVGLGALGLALVALSLVPGPGPDGAWLRDFFMTIGASLALFAPFYLITRSLDHHLDRVADHTARQVATVRTETESRVEEVRTEAAQARAALTEDVQALRDDVDRRLEIVAERVTARLAAEAAANQDAIAALRTQPARDVLIEAFTRAHRLGLISASRLPRVDISHTGSLYVSVDLDPSDNYVDEPLHSRPPNHLHPRHSKGMGRR